MKSPKQQNIDMLAKWDSGQSIWSIELGGLGPSYEQVIQVVAIECVRTNKHEQPPKNEDLLNSWARGVLESTLAFLKSRGFEDAEGVSGAQAEAAMRLMCKAVLLGWESAIEVVEFDCRILVDRGVRYIG